MKIAAALLTLSLALPITARATPADDEFQKMAGDYIESRLRAHPEDATELGDHRFDDKLTDYSAETRAKELSDLKSFLEKLNNFAGSADLTGANKVDFRILKESVEGEIFSLEEMKEAGWNPLLYNQSLANSLYLLIAREFAPPADKVPNLRKRMEAIPAVIAQAKANLKNPPKIHTETAIEQMQGAISFVREGLGPVLDRVPQMKKEIAPLQEKTAAALEEYKKWLEKDLLPRSDGDFRIGPDKFRKKLRFSLASDLPMEEIMKRARADLAATTEALYARAILLYVQYFPKAEEAEVLDQKRVISTVLNRLSEKRPNDATVVSFAEKTLSDATRFTKEKDLVTVFDEPLKIIVMPEFRRGQGIAYCDSPGPLEKGGETFYAMEPTPASWPKERKESFYREYNNYMMHNLTVHEAMPGHFLQLTHANRFKAPTLVRAIFRSGTFIEGWGVYTEQIMAEAGYGAPEVEIQQLKMRLRVICNAILDQGIHTANMSEQEALDLMMKEGFQQEGEAVAKWKRARLSSTQLSTYFVGVAEHLDLRDRARNKLGDKFDLKTYNDQVLSYGSPPVKYVRELMEL